jgi:hypothetical protein
LKWISIFVELAVKVMSIPSGFGSSEVGFLWLEYFHPFGVLVDGAGLLGGWIRIIVELVAKVMSPFQGFDQVQLVFYNYNTFIASGLWLAG